MDQYITKWGYICIKWTRNDYILCCNNTTTQSTYFADYV